MGKQILKTRDDHNPVILVPSQESAEGEKEPKSGPFTLSPDTECSWLSANEEAGPEKLRPRIEPWLTALVQSEHLSLLVGSGLTHAVHSIAAGGSATDMGTTKFDVLDDEITAEANRISKAAGRNNGNIEDQIRAATELLRGIEIHTLTKEEGHQGRKTAKILRDSIETVLQSFAQSILSDERDLAKAESEKREEAFNYLVSFLMSFASRTGTRERLHVFTTNYDRYIEAGADTAGLRLIDRFVGTLMPIFRSSRLDVDLHYNPPGIRGEPRYLEGVARFTKLHGSVDWVDSNRSIRRLGLPFGAEDLEPYLKAPGLTEGRNPELMIYPNSSKDRETADYPYVELFRDFAAGLCRPNSTLFCYGYSFGDEHINRVIDDMLTIPSTHLVVIAYGDELGRIMEAYQRSGRQAQITLMIGDHFGDLRTLVDHYLPKPAIDRTTFKMAELLKARLGTETHRSQSTNDDSTPDGDPGS